MKKIYSIILGILIGSSISYFIFNTLNPSFENLSPEQMYQRIIQERDFAISKAAERGDYRCCISPDCTMCYMEANKWNNFTAGTCACDDLIIKGEEPCPQCKKGVCEVKGEDISPICQ